MDTVIGIDLGTSSIKALLMDLNGRVLASREMSYQLYSPFPGWAEQNPDEWWQSTQQVLRKLSTDIYALKANVLSIGLSGQMNGAVLLDQNYTSIRPCIIWADGRTIQQCEDINRSIEQERLTLITGKLAVTGYTAPKLLWVREKEPDNFAAVRHILLPKDFIRLRLTGELFTDLSDASNTLLFDINHKTWSDEILDILELKKNLLPEAVSSLTLTGVLSRKAAEMTGLRQGIPIIAGAGDSSAEAVGSGFAAAGPVLSVIGSAGNISAICDRSVVDSFGRIHTGCHVTDHHWILTGVQQAAGLSIRWLVETLNLFSDCTHADPGNSPYNQMIDQASQIESGSNGLVYLPYLTGERTPHLDPLARGVFFGINIHHNRAHFARAVFEGIAYAQRDALELLVELGLPAEYIVAAGGGSRSGLWKQILADVTNLPVMTTSNEHSAAYGAALVAAVSVGAFENIEAACRETSTLTLCATPQPALRDRYDETYNEFRLIYQQLKPVFARSVRP